MATASLLDVARHLGGVTWLLRQAFSLFGTWARDDESPRHARLLATASNRHGELAVACFERLPTIALTSGQVLTPEQFVSSPHPDDEALISKLELGAPAESRREVVIALTARITELAGELRATVDERLDEPTAALLDDLTARLDAVAAAGRSAAD